MNICGHHHVEGAAEHPLLGREPSTSLGMHNAPPAEHPVAGRHLFRQLRQHRSRLAEGGQGLSRAVSYHLRDLQKGLICGKCHSGRSMEDGFQVTVEPDAHVRARRGRPCGMVAVV